MLSSRASDLRPTYFVSVNNPIALTDHGRYHYLLIKFLALSGCRCILDRDSLLASDSYFSLRYGSFLRLDKQLQALVFIGPRSAIQGSHYAIGDNPQQDADLDVQLVYDFFPEAAVVNPCELMMPQPMHPVHYIGKDISWLTQSHYEMSSNKDRSVVIGFNGNTSQLYDKNHSRNGWRLRSRNEIISSLDRYHRSRPVPAHIRTSYLESRQNTQMSQWLNKISHYQFFVCPPGVNNPFCHNLAEAMHAGAIPVLAYGFLAHPSLSPGLNCVAYSDSGLDVALDAIYSLGSLQVDALKSGVAGYYREHMLPDRFSKKLAAAISLNQKQVKLFLPFF